MHFPRFPAWSCLRRAPLALLVAWLAAFCQPDARGQESVYQGCFPGNNGSLSDVTAFESLSGKGASITNFFKNWDSASGPYPFPTAIVDAMRGHGSIPMLTWQPQGASPDATYALANIANGNFDSFITQWALEAKAWQYRYFGVNWSNAAVAGDTADPDGDGLPNLPEYALGKSPGAAGQPGITTVLSGGTLTMIYTLANGATDLTAQPEWSTDLSIWSIQDITTQVISDDGTIQTIQAWIPSGTNVRAYLRLHVTRP